MFEIKVLGSAYFIDICGLVDGSIIKGYCINQKEAPVKDLEMLFNGRSSIDWYDWSGSIRG